MRGPAVLALTVLLLAGCAGSPADDMPEAPSGPVPSYAFACGEGMGERVPGVCMRRLESAAAQYTEPALAWHPADPAVLALGVHAVGLPSVLAGGALVAPAVYVTEDQGSSWQERLVPLPPSDPGTFAGDPAVAFTPDGVLHYSAMAQSPGFGSRLFVASSADLGATWSAPQVLFVGMDREWFAVGPDGTLFLSWQDYPDRSHVAWSLDSGKTWSEPLAGPDGCITASPVGFIGGHPHLACSVAEEPQQLLRLDVDAATLEPVTRPPAAGIAPRILASGDMVVLTTYSGGAATSLDGGATWNAWAWLPDVLTVDEQWGEAPQVYWSELDGNALHLLVAVYHRSDTGGATPGRHGVQDAHRVAHVLLDARDLTLVRETQLTPDEPESMGSPPASAVPILGDDWYAMARHGDALALAWAWGGGIDVAFLEPSAAAAPA